MSGELKAALEDADSLVEQLKGPEPGGPKALTMGRLQKCSYTHDALIDLIIKTEGKMDQNQLAGYFGYTPGWISNIMASEAFKERMAARREEVIDPVLRATINERFEALVHQSLNVLMAKLSMPQVSDNVALRAAELGAKAVGIGGHGHAPQNPTPQADRLERLADRLLALQANVRERSINGEAELLEVKPAT